MQKAYLILENGSVLEGQSFGATGTTQGELVFTTSMTGCAESLSDPSYFGQIVMYTFPQLGNYGVSRDDMEHPHCHLRGVVVREFCETPSNFRCQVSIDEFLKQEHVIGISGIDTRQLTQLIRDQGVMNAEITTEKPIASDLCPNRVTDAVAHTSIREMQTLSPKEPPKFSVALLDYGVKNSIANHLVEQGCQVTVCPFHTPAEEILTFCPNGILLSNGPGNPAENAFCIQQIQKLFGKVPLFGIGLGHQMMALAAGAKTVKLKFGHRGANHPVKDLTTGKISITSQNHGYAVDAESLHGTEGVLRFVNVNDGTCEGIDYPNYRAFSLQFYPDSQNGSLDSHPDFNRFFNMMEEW